MTKLSCKQFAGYDKDNMSVIMMRLEGYYTDENGEAVIGFKMAGDTVHLLVYYGDHADDDIITAAEEVLDKYHAVGPPGPWLSHVPS